jgi:hypothetical protein
MNPTKTGVELMNPTKTGVELMNPTKTGVELICSRRICSFCFTYFMLQETIQCLTFVSIFINKIQKYISFKHKYKTHILYTKVK